MICENPGPNDDDDYRKVSQVYCNMYKTGTRLFSVFLLADACGVSFIICVIKILTSKVLSVSVIKLYMKYNF